MDDYERTTQRIRTEEVIPVEPVARVDPAIAAVPIATTQPVAADRIVTEHESIRETPTALEMARRIVGLAFGILQGMLVIRIILLLLVANRQNDIVQFILGITAPFVTPFRDMFALDRVAASGSVLDIAAIVAIIAWTLVEMLIFAILNLGSRRSRTAAY